MNSNVAEVAAVLVILDKKLGIENMIRQERMDLRNSSIIYLWSTRSSGRQRMNASVSLLVR